MKEQILLLILQFSSINFFNWNLRFLSSYCYMLKSFCIDSDNVVLVAFYSEHNDLQ